MIEVDDTSIDDINSVNIYKCRKLAMANMGTFSKMDDDNTIYFTMNDADQIYFLQQWFISLYLRDNITDMAELI